MKTELLAPAGSFEIGKAALYAGCDAIYLALGSFGARAYAKNFTVDELKEIINIAHALNKKVFVTVNTIIKNSELEAVYNFLDEIYLLGVDAVICADIAVFMYVINNCSGMECHISTQVGVKDLYDTLFFEKIGAHRVVLAREDSIEQIKHIKENSNIDLEVFIHGALCVSYSGGCLFSSLLSLRSGNRGRCSQNCRREYVIYENDKALTKTGYYLSLKDLCVGSNVNQLVKLGVNSLKIEGRMKNVSYVDVITRYYRSLIDNGNADFEKVNQIFHRQFTKGFIFNEDRKDIATIKDASSQGKLIGSVISRDKNRILLNIDSVLRKGERLRFYHNDESIYLTVEELYDTNNKILEEAIGKVYIKTDLSVSSGYKVYKMSDNELDNFILNSDIVPLEVFVTGHLNDKLGVTVKFNDNYIYVESEQELVESEKNPLTKDIIYRQLNKLNETPFYIEDIVCDLDDELFLSVSSLNQIRRNIVKEIYNLVSTNRINVNRNKLYLKRRFETLLSNKLIAFVNTEEQYKACKDAGLTTIFYKNHSPYVNSKYHDIEEDEVLISNYGGIYKYPNKNITTDFSFNVMNKDSILHLLNIGAAHITLSYEMTFGEIKDLAIDFYKTYGMNAPIDMIVYGKQKLMTMKYCPLKKIGLCGKCKEHKYYLKDKFGKFIINPKDGCFVEIYNELPLNLVEDMNKLSPYIDRFRFNFLDESYEEVISILKNATDILTNNIDQFKLEKQTKGHFKRSIL